MKTGDPMNMRTELERRNLIATLRLVYKAINNLDDNLARNLIEQQLRGMGIWSESDEAEKLWGQK